MEDVGLIKLAMNGNYWVEMRGNVEMTKNNDFNNIENDSTNSRNEKRFILKENGVIDDIQLNILLDGGKDKEDMVDLLNALHEENKHLKNKLEFFYELNKPYGDIIKDNEQLKKQINKLEAQLFCPFDSVCIRCNNEYLVQKDDYYVSKCKKGHGQCSKVDVKYCDDFEVKELQL